MKRIDDDYAKMRSVRTTHQITFFNWNFFCQNATLKIKFFEKMN